MRTVSLTKYGPIISDKAVGDQISSEIESQLAADPVVQIDLEGIKSMATFCAKQVFGRLYLALGSESFYDKIKIINATEDLKLLIRMGIQNALDEKIRA
jgi:hypothetical protein